MTGCQRTLSVPASLVNVVVSGAPATRGTSTRSHGCGPGMTEGRGRRASINQPPNKVIALVLAKHGGGDHSAQTLPRPLFYFHIYFSIHHYPGYCTALIDAHTLAHSAVNLNDTFHHLSICTSSSSSSRLPVL